MKILITILTLLLATTALFGVVTLPAAAGTNYLAVFQGNQQISQRYFDSGRLDEIRHRMDVLQDETLFLAIATGAAGAALVLLMGRDQIRESRRVQENHAENPNANK